MSGRNFILTLSVPLLVAGLVWWGVNNNHRWLTVRAAPSDELAGAAVAGVSVEAAALSVPPAPDSRLTDLTPEIYLTPVGTTDLTGWLTAQQVPLFLEDILHAFPDPALGVGARVSVYRAQAVLVKDAGADRLIHTWSTTIAAALADNGIELGELDEVTPPADASPLTPNRLTPVTVTITRVEETDVVEQEQIPFQTIEKKDDELEKGLRRTVTAGRAGKKELTWHVRRENGAEVSRRLVKTEVTRPVQDALIKVGTKVLSYGTGVATWYTKALRMVAAHNTLARGTKVRVVNLANGQSVVVTVVGGGLYTDAVIDLSYDAFAAIGDPGAGRLRVRLEKVYD